MATIEWKDEYRTGFKSIDYEHEILIYAVNALCGEAAHGDGDGVAKALMGIHTLIEVHFVLEEKIMRDRNYPYYTKHKRDHDRLLDEIHKLMDDAETMDPATIMPRLARQANEWFDKHFATHDRALHGQT